MYLRHSVRHKNGKSHTYWRLVRSVRLNGKVVQETVAQLGELDAQGRARARDLARQITGRGDQAELFEEPAGSEQRVAVRLDKVRLERGLRFGDVWLGWTLWRALRFDEVFAQLIPQGREEVSWPVMAAVLVLARLSEPSSELHIAEDWYRKTALEDLLGLDSDKVNEDRLYRALDQILPHKAAVEQHIRARLGELFDIEYDLLLYDVTSTYFEGQAEGNALAARGHSRDHRPDCKQVCIALVVTRQGLPLGYEVFAGNRTDVTTVEEIVTTMEKRHGRADRVWVMDRGMVSEDNLEWLRQDGRKYLVGTPKSDLKKWQHRIVEQEGWSEIREGIEVKLCAGPEGPETFILCRSAQRKQKEQAMHERFAQRIRKALESLAGRLERARKPVDARLVERQIGRLLQRNTRAAGGFEIHVDNAPERASGLRLRWKERAEWLEWAQQTEGYYILRTNVSGWSSEDLWRTYIQLTEAEAAFRIHKTDLSIRPIWHQKAERVQAHIFVCFLAYVMWKTLEQWQSRAGLGNSPRTILEELGRIQSVDVVLPLADHPGREIRLRCVVRPDKSQAMLLDRLGLKLPERLRRPTAMAKM
jgi:transposase